MSEAFVNDARTQTAYMPITTAQPNTATSSPLTIEYKASTQTYTVTTQGRTQDFGPAQKDATLSTAEATVYSRSAGALTETLSLSTNSTDPGTPDAPLFRYVGSGLWQRTQTDAPNSTATMDYFTYGVPTPASAMPKSGTATFGVRIDGEAGYSNYILVLKGGGRFSVDFASGKLTGSGTMDGYIAGALKHTDMIWSSQATLASGAPPFPAASVPSIGRAQSMADSTAPITRNWARYGIVSCSTTWWQPARSGVAIRQRCHPTTACRIL
ncbi:hypothetical protein ACFS32_19050 [Novosphingobium pokkalii]|uniref:hypothetical protein n=1 Tax=Novosphingobium pokkalii TaxID=1770194 RepID=UPI00363A50B2